MKDSNTLEIIYRDEYIVAINKPNGLLVHRSKIAAKEDVFALQLLRDQIQQKVYPVHRLDRKTSGVLLFAFSGEIASIFQQCLSNSQTQKKYLVIVRGYFPASIDVDYPLINDSGKKQEAQTSFKSVVQSEIPIPLGKFPSSRYSLIEAYPKTGRMHQIRKHLNHLRHPIIGDRPHGCSKQNRLFKEKWNMQTMLLHAQELSFKHPMSSENLTLKATLNSEFQRMQKELRLL